MPERKVGRTLIRVLGQPRVEINGTVRPIRGAPARVLCHLVIKRSSRIDTDSLISRLWSEPPPSARTSVQVAVHKLRAAIEPDRHKSEEPAIVKHSDSGYWLDLTTCHIDIEMLESGLQTARALARAGQWAQVTEGLESALALWDEPFGSLGDEPSLVAEAERLRAIRMESEELLSEAELQYSDFSVERLRDLARSEPLRERRWEHVIRGLHANGRQAEALRTFTEAAEALGEIGLEPGPDLQQLEERILAGHPPSVAGNLQRRNRRLVGRAAEFQELASLASPGAIVSVTGPPGIGKSHLVNEFISVVAVQGRPTRLVRTDGVSTDPVLTLANQLLGGIADINTDPLTLVAEALPERCIVVVDGLREDLGWSTVIRELHARSPATTIVTTAVEPLGLRTESELRLGPLDLPSVGTADPWASPAVKLFASEASSNAAIQGKASEVAEIVRNLGGHPLSIQMAARLTTLLGIEETLARTKRQGAVPIRLPMPPSSWVASVLHSLESDAAEVCALVGCLVGEWTMGDVRRLLHRLGNDAYRISEVVEELARRSLVEHKGGGIFQTWTMVREAIATESEFQVGDLDRALAGLAEELHLRLRTADQADAVKAINRMAPDFEEALARAISSGDAPLAWQFFGSMGQYWWLRHARAKSLYWESRVMAIDPYEEVKPETAIRALTAAGISGFTYLRFSENRNHLERAVAIADAHGPSVDGAIAYASLAIANSFEKWGDSRTLELAETAVDWALTERDPFALALAQFALGIGHGSHLDFDTAVRLVNRAIGTADEASIPGLRTFLRMMLGHLQQYRMALDAADSLYSEAIRLNSKIDGPEGVRIAGRYGKAEIAQLRGDMAEAKRIYEECLEGLRSTGDARSAVLCSTRLALLEVGDGNFEAGERHLGFAKAHQRFHDEDSLNACVQIAEAHIEAAAGRIKAARTCLEKARASMAGIGSPLGPIDASLYQSVETKISEASIDSD